MNFTDFFIRRPVLATALSLVIFLLGLRAYLGMTVRQYPKMTNTTITVTTVYPGASPTTVQGFLTTPLERVIATAPGISYMTSTSAEGASTITVYMQLNYSPDAAVANIQSKIQQVVNKLPTGSELPVINVTVGDSTDLMYIAFYSPVMSQQQITDYLLRVVQPDLVAVHGVSQAQIVPAGTGSGNTFAMRVWLNPRKMAALHIDASQVAAALASNDYISAVGRTRSTNIAEVITATTSLTTAREFRNLIVAQVGDTPVRLKQLGHVTLGAETYTQEAFFNGTTAAYIGIQPTPTANSLDVARGVHRALARLHRQLPPTLHVAVPYDASTYITAALHEIVSTIAITLVVVIVVILLFLGSLRAAIIPAVAIPLSIVGAGLLMMIMHFTINLLTLLAIVLAIGLVVDDAIVVVENIHRHIEEGRTPLDAAILSGRELLGPIVVMSTTLVAVFAPIGFMGGLTGSLFSEFAFTLVAAVLVSMVIALTLSPMLSARVLRHSTPHGFGHFIDERFDRLRLRYDRLLHGSLDYLPVTLVFAAAMLISTYFLFTTTRQELAPQEDQGVLFVAGTAPPTATPHYLRTYGMQILHDFERTKGYDKSFMISGFSPTGAGDNSLMAGMHLVSWSKRSQSTMQLQPIVQNQMNHIAGLQLAVFQRPSLPGSAGGPPVQFVIEASAGYRKIDKVANQLVGIAQRSGLFAYVAKDLRYDNPQVVIKIHRNIASDLGFTMQDVAANLQPLLSGNYINRFDRAGRSYEVIPQVARKYRANPALLKDFYLRTPTGHMITLSTIASIHRQIEPEFLPQFQQMNSATIQAVPMPGVTMGQALSYLRLQARHIFPQGFTINYASESRQFMHNRSGLLVTFFLAILLIFLLLAAQFESFRDPLIVLVTVPMSISGALLFLSLGFGTINIYTEVGLITLIGLITKQGILIVQFANEAQRHDGLSKRQAVERASSIRLRPILMTTGAMAIGVLPLLLATGPGAAARFAMGLVIFTGLSLGSLFSLFVVPAMYMVLGKDHSHDAISGRPG
ncbi:MAG: efflux RND transporter permease subunit [Gammaproteobacteria bacterium]|nr:efflux RND transporter permease subunit [Gammaproteobacteria bacterium]